MKSGKTFKTLVQIVNTKKRKFSQLIWYSNTKIKECEGGYSICGDLLNSYWF